MKTAFALLLTALPAMAAPVAAQPAVDCPRAFDFVAGRVTRDYAGFADKVPAGRRAAYDSATAAQRRAAARAASAEECLAALRGWTAFFRDGHLGFIDRSPPAGVDTPAVRARFSGWPRRPLTEAAARAWLAAHAAALDPVEGIWQSADGRYRVAVVRDSAGGGFSAITLRADSVWWMPGQVKAVFAPAPGGRYEARFFMRDHAERRYTAEVARGVMRDPLGGVWLRLAPDGGTVDPERYAASLNTRFGVEEPEPGTVVVHLPSFDNPFAARIDSLFAAEERRVEAARTLIVDVRGNGGGSDYNYRHLVPLFYTRPIVTVGVDVLASPRNIAALEEMLAGPELPAGQRPWLERRLASLRAHPGEMVPQADDVTRGRPRATPRRVAVVMDRGCASSCEQLILAARQSDKVTLFGQNTAGVLDYANVVRVPVPGTALVLQYPTSRSRRLPADPVDPDGIAPQVRIPPDELFPVEWVRRWLAAHP